ncbi:MAG: helix-turn-helix transcriptional regulator [Lachnospiraceae bacterium]|nr:helix-turn-helix transcriptional regulator [Lachnospiraceae bacterium]
MNEGATITIHLAELIEKTGLSKAKFCHKAKMKNTQLNRLLNQQTTRLDIGVLIRICDTLNCGIGDLLEYKKTE